MRLAREFADKHSLPRDRVWRAWQAGPSKLFLNDLEERFDTEMIAHLRELGVSALIAPSSTWGRNPLSSLRPSRWAT
jgi:alkylation response protein AidB-like acyl-CoA dehydrogenase